MLTKPGKYNYHFVMRDHVEFDVIHDGLFGLSDSPDGFFDVGDGRIINLAHVIQIICTDCNDDTTDGE